MSFVNTLARIARQPTLRSTLAMSSRSLSTITPVATKNAPPAAASYSQAIKANNFVYVSGQVPFTPEGQAVKGSITDQAEQVFANLKAILEEAGSGLDRAVKINVFLTDINDFAEFNVVYAKYFNTHKPARSCVAVKALPLGAALEVEAIALDN